MSNVTNNGVEFGDPRLPARFWTKVQPKANGCWHWTGEISAYGYYWLVGINADTSK